MNMKKRIVVHKQIYIKFPQGGDLNTTLCRKVRNNLKDGYNVTKKLDEVTCSFCNFTINLHYFLV